MNEAVAKSEALVLDTAENEQLGKEVSLMESQASAVVVATEADYSVAGDLIKTIKAMQKQVDDYWDPLRVAAKRTYDDVLAKKKAMIEPLKAAEKILKGKMGDFVLEQERKRQEQEEAMRKLAQAEIDRKLDEAATAEQNGDVMGVEFAMAEAEVMQGIAEAGSIPSQKPKANSVSTSKAWKIVSVDSAQVPVSIAGAVIRPVDESAVMALIKATKGKIEIPGIKYEETVTISVRS